MAREFDDVAASYIEASTAPVTNHGFTVAGWINPTTLDNSHTVICLSDKDGLDRATLNVMASGYARFELSDGTTLAILDAHTCVAGEWQHIAGVSHSSSSRYVFRNGTTSSENTTALTALSGISHTNIGRTVFSTTGIYRKTEGQIAEVGVWDTPLTDSEIATLAAGVSPLKVRPQNLVMYIPLVRENDEDIVGGVSFTAGNSPTVADHVNVFNSVTQIIPAFSAAGGTTVSVPVASLGLTGYAPSVLVSNNQTVSVPLASLNLTGYAPTVTESGNVTVDVPLASLGLTGLTPDIQTPVNIDVPVAAINLTGYAPTINTTVYIDVPAASLTLTGLQPTISTTNNQTVNVPVASLTLTGYAPSIDGEVVVWTVQSEDNSNWTLISEDSTSWTLQ